MTNEDRFALAKLANCLDEHLCQDPVDADIYYVQDVLENPHRVLRVYATVVAGGETSSVDH